MAPLGLRKLGTSSLGTHGPQGGPASHSCLALVWVSQGDRANGCHPRSRLFSLMPGAPGDCEFLPRRAAMQGPWTDLCSRLVLLSVSPALESRGREKWRARVEGGAMAGSL